MQTEDIHYVNHLVEVAPGYSCAVHQMYQNPDGIPVIMIHGAIENARIFYSLNGKGFGPFLARNGYNVFAIDLRGKGDSEPKIAKGFKGDMDDCINLDINKIYEYISPKVNPAHSWVGVGHSWGGVLLLSHYARYAEKFPIKKLVFFGTKRKIYFNSFVKIAQIVVGFSFIGSILNQIYGYMPTKDKLNLGTENESFFYFRDLLRWIFSKKWVGKDGFDYSKEFKQKPMPAILNIIGAADNYLGEKGDCEKTLLQCVDALSMVTTMYLSKKNGYATDYGHNNMLSDKRAIKDYFPFVLEWMKNN